MELKNEIRKFIESNLIIFDDDVEFLDSDNIFEMGFVNSLFAMKLLNYVESEYSIVVDNDDMDLKNFSSVNNIVNLINKKRLTLTI